MPITQKMSITHKPRVASGISRRMPNAFQEMELQKPVVAWLQILRDESWDPASVLVTALHVDGQGVRLDCPIALSRGTRLVVNLALTPPNSLHMQGVVQGTRKRVGGTVAVVRFENQTTADRMAIREYITRFTSAKEQPPSPTQRVEGRRYQRYLKSVPVRYQVLRPDGTIAPGQGQMMTLDIGGGGMKIRLDQKLEKGDLLYLHLPLDNVPFFGLGHVAWLDDSRVKGRYVAGLTFIDLSESEQTRLVNVLSAAA